MSIREHIFKAKRKDNGEWVEGYLLAYSDGTFNIVMDCITYDIYYEVDPDTVCEYTGLTDKNGTKIFEGDICEYEFEDIGKQKAVVFYSDKYASFLVKPIGDFQFVTIQDGIVIGNIYDDPELLEVKE